MKLLKNRNGYLSVESAMILPIVMSMVFVLMIILHDMSLQGALASVEIRKQLIKDLSEPPSTQLFYRIAAVNKLSEFINTQKEDLNDQRKKTAPSIKGATKQ